MVDAILFAAHMAVGREIVGVVVVGVGRVPRMEAQLQPLKLKLKKVRPTLRPDGALQPRPVHRSIATLQSRPGPL